MEHKAAVRRDAELRARMARQRLEELVRLKTIGDGMTAEQVRRAWGEPKRINSIVSGPHSREQWVYGTNNVYLFDGLVESH